MELEPIKTWAIYWANQLDILLGTSVLINATAISQVKESSIKNPVTSSMVLFVASHCGAIGLPIIIKRCVA